MQVSQLPIETTWCIEASFAEQLTAAMRAPPRSGATYTPPAVTSRGNVALIECRGPITKYPSLLQPILGGAAVVDLQAAFTTAISDPSVNAVVLVIDSPGGAVSGVASLADQIYAARQSGKTVVVQVDGMLCSAAYWLASGATKIFASHATDKIGSLGVMAVFQDTSRAASMAGVDVFVATTGALKPIGIPGAPITAEMRTYLQATVEATQREFTAAIQRGRPISATMLKSLSDGSVVPADFAKVAGLIDGIQSLETTIAQLNGAKVLGTNINQSVPQASAIDRFRAEIDKRMTAGMTRASAACDVVKTMPDLHGAVLAESSGRPVPAVDAKPGEWAGKFRAAIDSYAAKGIGKGEAVSKLVREQPELYRAFMTESTGRQW